ncbi:MAG: GTPase [Planctomycetota bacterium]|nr:GTPase [Planctomycetota bacterium]
MEHSFRRLTPTNGAIVVFEVLASEALVRRALGADPQSGNPAFVGVLGGVVLASPGAGLTFVCCLAGAAANAVEGRLHDAGLRAQVTEISSARHPIAIDCELMGKTTPQGFERDAHVCIIGHPNTGKSSLLNALARANIATAADYPGTTRDAVGVILEVQGLRCRVFDTPGVRETVDELEVQAQRLALEVARSADLILLCGDAAHPPPDPVRLFGGDWAGRVKRMALRADLGAPSWACDLTVSVRIDPDAAAKAVGDLVCRTLAPEIYVV